MLTTARRLPAVVALAWVLSLPGPAAAAAAAAPHLTPPGCSNAAATAVAAAPTLPVTPLFANVPGLPFDVETTPDGHDTFVSSQGAGQPDHTGGGAILVYHGDGGSGAAAHTVYLGDEVPSGMAFTDRGRILLVAAGRALLVLDVDAAERGAADAVAWTVPTPGSGAIEVAPTPDGHFAFVTMETSDQVDVFRLSGTHEPRYVGTTAVGRSPVGVTFSRDGATAYVTSEIELGNSTNLPGTLSLLRVAVAERTPQRAVERTVSAGCQPVRVVVSADGRTVWVTARGSDALLGFSAAALARGDEALTADVAVGIAPVGLAFFDGGRRLLVANSNRFGTGLGSLAVVNLVGVPALVGYVTAGGFPRQMTLEPGGAELDVTNYNSSQLETVPVAPLVAPER
jgi:DNA-binding beta-propeller fold protein YncE